MNKLIYRLLGLNGAKEKSQKIKKEVTDQVSDISDELMKLDVRLGDCKEQIEYAIAPISENGVKPKKSKARKKRTSPESS